MSTRPTILPILLVLATGCPDKTADKTDEKPPTSKAPSSSAPKAPATAKPSDTRDKAPDLGLGTTAEGEILCEGGKKSAFLRAVGKDKLGLQYELKSKGEQACTHLNVLDAQGNPVDTLAARCTEATALEKVATPTVSVAEGGTLLEIRSDQDPCVPFSFRVTGVAPQE